MERWKSCFAGGLKTMMNDNALMEAVIRKGIQFKIEKGELTEEQADEILKPLGGYKKKEA